MAERPSRPSNHVLESWSASAFESLLPPEWVVHRLDADYGVDRRVEIFENGRTTGFAFNVQLKATEKGSGTRPAKPIRRATLGYWYDLADPTLVVIAHKPTDTLWYRWAHLLGYDSSPETVSRQVRCEDRLTAGAAESLKDEVIAFRHAKELQRHLPIDVSISGESFYGESSAPLRGALSRLFAQNRPFVHVARNAPSLPYFFVRLEDQRAQVGIRGASAGRQLTWKLEGPRDYAAIAADISAVMGIQAAYCGAEDLATKLLIAAAPDSGMLTMAQDLGSVVAMLTRRDETDAVVTLIRRTYCIEGHPQGMLAVGGFLSAADEASRRLRRKVGYAVRDAARTWVSPAIGLYNAANLLGTEDGRESLVLYEEAAMADPSYRNRGYWWREKGTTLWNIGNLADAQRSYEKAAELGEERAQPLLADAVMRTGNYKRAWEILRDANIWETASDAQWRLCCHMLNHILLGLGIESQIRNALSIPQFQPQEGSDLEREAIRAIRVDALNGWAYVALVAVRDELGVSVLMEAICAAVLVPGIAEVWLGLLSICFRDTVLSHEQRMSVAHDALTCAWAFFGEAFAETIYADESLSDAMRQDVFVMFDSVRPEPSTFELRHFGQDGTESTRIPIGRRRPESLF